MPKLHPAIESMRPQTAQMVERLYSPLVAQLRLSPEQTREFYQVLLDNKMSGIAQKSELFSHGDIARMSQAVADSKKEMHAALQSLLGDANFAQFQNYQAGVGDRGALEMMKSDLAQNPLTPEQHQQLLDAMQSARITVGGAAGNAEFSIADTSDVMDQKLVRQQAIDQIVLHQAADFLSSAQLEILRTWLARAIQFRKEGYAKAREMFGGGGKSD